MKLDWTVVGSVHVVEFQGYTALIEVFSVQYVVSIRGVDGILVKASTTYSSLREAKQACETWLSEKDKPEWVEDEEWLHHTFWRGLKIAITPTQFDDGFAALVWQARCFRKGVAYTKTFETVEEAKEGVERWVKAL